MVKILITGGLGHLGSYCLQNLPKNYKITINDDFTTQRYCSLFNLKKTISLIDDDFCNISIDKLREFDVVLHLAAITNATTSFDKKNDIEKVNIDKTQKFINNCKNANIKRFIFPSSTSIYGVATEIVDEYSSNYINPQSPYAESKVNIENFIEKNLGEETKYLILRFGTIFGYSKGMRFHTAINKFCYEAAINKPLTVWKQNYEQVRPYLGLNDMLRSIIFFIERDDKIWNSSYNAVSFNKELKEIINTIKENLLFLDKERQLVIDFCDTPLLNQFSYNVSTNKLESLGFNFVDDIDNSISQTLKLLSKIKNI